jgi:Rrf2 family protein
MRISARTDYACKALLELTRHWPSKDPLQVHAISEKQDIPMRYLVQILIQLKRLRLVKSARGKEGGYNLALPPNKISLGYVLRQIGGPLLPLADSSAKNGSAFSNIWKDVELAMASILDNITFEEIMEKAEGYERIANYQI